MFHKRPCNGGYGLFLYLLLCVVCVQEILAQGTQLCPGGWRYYVTPKNELTCVWFSNDIVNWIDARSWCQAMDAQLVEIETAQFNIYLMNLIIQRKIPGKYWIGSTDMENEVQYKWMTSGTRTPVMLFLPGQLYSTTAKNCVCTDENAYWSVEDCKMEFMFICQKTVSLSSLKTKQTLPTA